MQESRELIKKWRRRLRFLLAVAFWLIPLVTVAYWLCANMLPLEEAQRALLVPIPGDLPLSARLMAIAATMLPAGVSMYGVWVLKRLFGLYEQGEIFTESTVGCFRSLARTLFLWFGASVLSVPLLSLALTLHFPPGERMVSLSLGSPDLTALFVGAMLRVAAWVMAEGHRLSQDQELTI